MNLIKNKWFLGGLLALGLIFLGLKYRNEIKFFFGGWKETKSGMRYRFTQGDPNKKNLGGEFTMLINYMLIGPDGDTITNNFKSDTLMEVPYPVEPTSEVLEALAMMNTNTTVEALVLSDSLKKRVEHLTSAPGYSKIMFIPPGEYARFVIRVKKVMNEEEFEGYNNQKKIARVLAEGDMIDKLVQKSPHQYLLDSFLHFRYYIYDRTDKPRIQRGDEIEYNVEVKTFDGALIVNSAAEGRKYHAVIGKNTYELPALDILPTYLAEGENGQFVITSALGFGARGAQNVKSYSPLIINIFDIKKLNR